MKSIKVILAMLVLATTVLSCQEKDDFYIDEENIIEMNTRTCYADEGNENVNNPDETE